MCIEHAFTLPAALEQACNLCVEALLVFILVAAIFDFAKRVF